MFNRSTYCTQLPVQLTCADVSQRIHLPALPHSFPTHVSCAGFLRRSPAQLRIVCSAVRMQDCASSMHSFPCRLPIHVCCTLSLHTFSLFRLTVSPRRHHSQVALTDCLTGSSRRFPSQLPSQVSLAGLPCNFPSQVSLAGFPHSFPRRFPSQVCPATFPRRFPSQVSPAGFPGRFPWQDCRTGLLRKFPDKEL